MKVTERVQYNRENTTCPVEWGSNMDALDVIKAVTAILSHQRDRDNGDVHSFQGRLTTTTITIEL